MYLDESGFNRLDDPHIEETTDFFILGGVIIKEEYHLEYYNKFKFYKNKLFPDELKDVPIHAVELNNVYRSSKNRYKGYMTEIDGKKILSNLYEFITGFPIEIIPVIIDNYSLRKQYHYPFDPYPLAYEFIIEKFLKIIQKRNEPQNQFGTIFLSHSSSHISSKLKIIHKTIKKEGTRYVDDYSSIIGQINIEETPHCPFYEIADMVCYAFRRYYYAYLCKNLGHECQYEGYLNLIEGICTLRCGSFRIGDKICVKIFPKPRFHKAI
jgi:hypothetical protein